MHFDLIDAPLSRMSVELARTLEANVALATVAKKRVIQRSLNYHR